MPHNKPKLLAGLLLAAGGSSRLGTPKQLIVWRSKPLIVHAVEQILAVCDAGVVVVTGAHADAVAASLQAYPVELLHNPEWRSGVGKSLADGVRVLRAKGAIGILVMLCDQPLVLKKDLLRLTDAWQDAPHIPAAALYRGAAGVPAIFPYNYFEQLTELLGDTGARTLLRGQNECTIVDMPRAAIDIDTAEDIASLRRYDQHSNEN
jgi:molybdenum cofactor cytidylyltransferase